ncbi:DUF6580 family putative transport protein [Leptospira stimsonii]|uniref:Uncharacterized protein n=1 Tax=Leptospira stimsonii TaxID=2202203 RepID=A0A4R9L6K2_9LEPT|nr:DUF6580 family putative transport protein [Leptospira stimsonii]RHX87893.1 hypothetical protein DLM78_02650 [Leptospira stimsonii]TGK11248.1 hypothetical protein EHO98_22195 [Leptospira stimsonii]TGM19234.1 hypothetical protein EHQ90_04860 [Leptospira stimsonii]
MDKIKLILQKWKATFAENDGISAVAVFFAGISRFLPHPSNFTSVGAMTVYSGARLQGWKSFAFPLILMLVTDFVLSRLHGFEMFYEGISIVYLSLMVNVLIGKFFLTRQKNLIFVSAVSIFASIQFFVLSNFSVWAFSSLYTKTWDGLLTCYIVAIPYFAGTLLGDLLYTSALFGTLDRLELKFRKRILIPENRTEKELTV